MSSFLSFIAAPFLYIHGALKDAISRVVPKSLEEKIGMFAHTFGANLYHDFGDLAHTLTSEVVDDVWTALETTAKNLAPAILAGKVSFADAVKLGVNDLKSQAATVMLPALEKTSEQTITNWLPNLITTSMAVASANPTSAPASSQAASPAASSAASSKS